MEKLPRRYQYQVNPFKASWEFLCPVCKIVRRSFYWPSPRKRHYVSLSIFGAGLAFGLSPWLGIKGGFFIFPIWAVFEFYYRAKARQSISCPSCGFDPYLYKYRPKLAKAKMEAFFVERDAQRVTAKERRVKVAAEKAGKRPDDPEELEKIAELTGAV